MFKTGNRAIPGIRGEGMSKRTVFRSLTIGTIAAFSMALSACSSIDGIMGSMGIGGGGATGASAKSGKGIAAETQDEPIVQDMIQILAPEMNDPKLEASMLALAKKTIDRLNKAEPQNYTETVLKVVISNSDWDLVRNDLDVILGRTMKTQVIGQAKADMPEYAFKAGDYFTRTWSFYEDYVGGDFSPVVKLYGYAGYGHGERLHVPESNALDAIAGNFDFTK
jgi:hypothetical protein